MWTSSGGFGVSIKHLGGRLALCSGARGLLGAQNPTVVADVADDLNLWSLNIQMPGIWWLPSK